MDTNPYKSPETAVCGTVPSQQRPRLRNLPVWLAFFFFVVPTAISGTLLVMAHAAGIEAGVGTQGLDSPGWKYLYWIPLVDLPAYIVVGVFTGAFQLHPFDAFCELEDIHTTFVVSRFLWPVVGFVLGLIFRAYVCSLYYYQKT